MAIYVLRNALNKQYHNTFFALRDFAVPWSPFLLLVPKKPVPLRSDSCTIKEALITFSSGTASTGRS